MPALPNVPNTLLCRVVGTNGGATYNNVFHMGYTGAQPNAALLDTTANLIQLAYQSAFLTLLNTAIAVELVELVDLTSPTSASGVSNLAGAPGTRAGTPMTAQVATVLSWHINLRYRGGHPRSYLPAGTIEDTVGSRTWTAGFITEAQTGASSFLTNINAMTMAGTPLVFSTVSYRHANALRPTPLVFPIVGSTVHSRVDTQRRRLGKEGN